MRILARTEIKPSWPLSIVAFLYVINCAFLEKIGMWLKKYPPTKQRVWWMKYFEDYGGKESNDLCEQPRIPNKRCWTVRSTYIAAHCFLPGGRSLSLIMKLRASSISLFSPRSNPPAKSPFLNAGIIEVLIIDWVVESLM